MVTNPPLHRPLNGPVLTTIRSAILQDLDFRGSVLFGGALSFTITAATGANGLQALLPAATPAGTLASLTANGSPVTFTTQTIKGITYAVFPAASGSYVATYAP